MKKSRGYSIVELLIILIVISILVVFSLRYIGNKPVVQAQSKELAAAIRYVQHRAISNSTAYYISINPNGYAAYDSMGNPLVLPSAHGSNVVTLPLDMSLSYDAGVVSNGYILFNRDGKPFVSTALDELQEVASIGLSVGNLVNTIAVEPETGVVRE